MTAEQSTRCGIYENVSFTALDGTTRTDTWVANAEEARAETDPWDPDTDDDGLTDGQELKWVTTAEQPVGSIQQIERANLGDRCVLGTSATTPDSDGDGYWDGWIGVYSVERTDNVILYREHLRDDDDGDGLTAVEGDDDGGIRAEEIVQEQTRTHEVSLAGDSSDNTELFTAARGSDIDNDGAVEHSNLHLGELHWGTQPDDVESTALSQTNLAVEVDYVRNEKWPGDGSPFALENENSVALTTAMERNYALYGLDVRFIESDEISRAELSTLPVTGPCVVSLPGNPTVTPEGFNRCELGTIEDRYHDNDSRLHLVWGTKLINDAPKTIIDSQTDYEDATGVAWHTGSPDGPLVRTVESDFGAMVARDQFSTNQYQQLQSVGMHELGHTLSVGWTDDAPIPYLGAVLGERAFEVYSGNLDRQGLTGGLDPTPEYVSSIGGTESPRWSVMLAGTAPDSRIFTPTESEAPVLLFSIEELSEADTEDVPSKEGN